MSNGFLPENKASSPPEANGRNLVLCFDGTTHKFEKDRITNVVRLFELLLKDTDKQFCYYQAGIGAYDAGVPLESRKASLKSTIKKTVDIAFATSIKKHVIAGYRFLMAHYEIGDMIYMFGFSRGAYTARLLCGMLDKVGLLTFGNNEQVEFAWDMYAKERIKRPSDERPITMDFKAIFGKKVSVHFLGIWDTVASTGWFRSKRFLPPEDGFIHHVYHAVALDECRPEFTALLYSGQESTQIDLENLKPILYTKTQVCERWFAGDHGDVGGSIPVDHRHEKHLANHSFRWITRAAALSDPGNEGLLFDYTALNRYYQVLFYAKRPDVLYRTPPMSMWFLLRLVTFPGEDPDSENEHFLYKYGRQLMRNQLPNEDLPANEQTMDDCAVNARIAWFWTAMRWVKLNPKGRPRAMPGVAKFHPSVNLQPHYIPKTGHLPAENVSEEGCYPPLPVRSHGPVSDMNAVQRAISHLEATLEEGHGDAKRLIELGVWYRIRYASGGSLADLWQAAELHSRALGPLNDEDDVKVICKSNLGSILLTLFERTKEHDKLLLADVFIRDAFSQYKNLVDKHHQRRVVVGYAYWVFRRYGILEEDEITSTINVLTTVITQCETPDIYTPMEYLLLSALFMCRYRKNVEVMNSGAWAPSSSNVSATGNMVTSRLPGTITEGVLNMPVPHIIVSQRVLNADLDKAISCLEGKRLPPQQPGANLTFTLNRLDDARYHTTTAALLREHKRRRDEDPGDSLHKTIMAEHEKARQLIPSNHPSAAQHQFHYALSLIYQESTKKSAGNCEEAIKILRSMSLAQNEGYGSLTIHALRVAYNIQSDNKHIPDHAKLIQQALQSGKSNDNLDDLLLESLWELIWDL